MKTALLVFDLDGTLIDSRLDIANAVNATMEHMGRQRLANELIYRYVGNGARVLIERAMGAGASPDQLNAAHRFLLAYYEENCLHETAPYPGVMEALRSMHDVGHRLAVLTNKPTSITHRVVSGLALTEFFFDVLGGDSLPHQKPHPVGLLTLRAAVGASEDSTWMIGDSAVDIETARNAKVRSCGVTYGFQPDTLKRVPPDLLVQDLREFAAHLRTLEE